MPDEHARSLLAEVAEDTQFISDSAVRVWERQYPLDARPARILKENPPYPPIVTQLGNLLYDTLYTRGGIQAFRQAHQASRPPGRLSDVRRNAPAPIGLDARAEDAGRYPDRLLVPDFIRYLARCNQTSESVLSGWSVVSTSDSGSLLQGADGRTARLPAGSLLGASSQESGSVRLERGSGTYQPGWYHARGAVALLTEVTPSVRVYWDLTRFGAGHFIRAATGELNKAGIPLHVKVLSNPQQFSRVDAGVLYLPRARWSSSFEHLVRIYWKVLPFLKDETPPFTKRIGRGVGLGEDPGMGGGESFGMHRCRLVAEGLWDSFLESPEASPSQRLESIARRFTREGISTAAPHLARDGPDPYVASLPAAAGGPAEVGALVP